MSDMLKTGSVHKESKGNSVGEYCQTDGADILDVMEERREIGTSFSGKVTPKLGGMKVIGRGDER